ncbi:FadR/GntR family transcriptional regulator [Portibacter lacus]|uniref:GntR family transcriptional regulator n=1 Tax=Portibacter lacus TaxID=1099794 RepID=A0AA37WED4_9BACT|nr:FCD domain-containing protein [Portibacter lacus]GLR15975.1 GntR family transcriptional regulator [Portibacter lacus]
MELDKIKAVDTLSLVDKVEHELMQYFKENNYKPGDPIAKELDLCDALGVSRTVVREALLRLRTLGFIDSKKHKGMTFKEPDIINNFERIMDPTLLGQKTLKSLFELRLILEMGMADFLFEYKTQEDLDELEEIVRLEEETSYDKTAFELNKEIAFHGKLYKISKNTTLQRFHGLLLPVFEYLYQQEEFTKNSTYEYTAGQFVSHRMLLNNLKVGTPETFRGAMRRHLEPHFDRAFFKKKRT